MKRSEAEVITRGLTNNSFGGKICSVNFGVRFLNVNIYIKKTTFREVVKGIKA